VLIMIFLPFNLQRQSSTAPREARGKIVPFAPGGGAHVAVVLADLLRQPERAQPEEDPPTRRPLSLAA
jgi:hypothetical protein